MGLRKKKPNISVIYKKSKRKNAKPYLEVFVDTYVDDIINARKRKPLLPDKYEIIEIGVGDGFEELYKEKYKI